MDPLLEHVLKELGKSPEEFEQEVEERKRFSPVQQLKLSHEVSGKQLVQERLARLAAEKSLDSLGSQFVQLKLQVMKMEVK